MAAITDISDLINRATGGNSGTPESIFWNKQPWIDGTWATNPVVGRHASLWRYQGANFPAGAIPTSVENPINSTPGALRITNPGGGRQKWLIGAWATQGMSGTFIFYDRLLHVGGLSGIVTTPQSVGGSLTRYVDGHGNFAFAEIYTLIGSTGSSIRLNSYTDSTPTSALVGPYTTFGGSGFREVTRAIMLPSGNTSGISDISTVQLSGSTGTAGNFGVTIGHPIAYLNVGQAGQCGWRDFTTGMPGIPEIKPDACLSLLYVPYNVNWLPDVTGGFSFVEA